MFSQSMVTCKFTERLETDAKKTKRINGFLYTLSFDKKQHSFAETQLSAILRLKWGSIVLKLFFILQDVRGLIVLKLFLISAKCEARVLIKLSLWKSVNIPTMILILRKRGVTATGGKTGVENYTNENKNPSSYSYIFLNPLWSATLQ